MSVPGLGDRLQREQQELSLGLCRVIGYLAGTARPPASGKWQLVQITHGQLPEEGVHWKFGL